MSQISIPTTQMFTPKKMTAIDLAKYCGELALEKKAENGVILDLIGRSSFTDYFLVFSGSSTTQVTAIAEHIRNSLKNQGYKIYHEEGIQEGRWAVLDLSDVVIHVFQDYMREFYNLEGLWHSVPRIRIQDRKERV